MSYKQTLTLLFDSNCYFIVYIASLLPNESFKMNSTLNADITCISDHCTAHINLVDVDMLFFDNFPSNLGHVLSGDMTLCNKVIRSRLIVDQACCVINFPFYIYINDSLKRKFADALLQASGHAILPVSEIVESVHKLY